MTALTLPYRISRAECTTAPVLLSIVIPAYNESRRVGESLRRIVRHLSAQPFRSEIVLVDDGCTDQTADISLDTWHQLEGRTDGIELRVLRNDRNRGKGYSVRQGMLISRGEWILFTDADLASPIDQLDTLLAAARDGADIAIGSRRLEPSRVHQPSWCRAALSATFSWVVRALALRGYPDTQCGFKLYHRSAGRTIASLQRTDRWSFDVEHLILAERLGYQVAQVGIRWSHQPGSKVRPVSAALGMIWDLLRVRWIHRNLGQPGRSAHHQARRSETIRIGDLLYQTHMPWWPKAGR